MDIFECETLRRKFHPEEFPGLPVVWGAVIGYMFDAKYTEPYFTNIEVTPGGRVLVTESDTGMIRVLCSYVKFEAVWGMIVDAVLPELTPDEVREVAILLLTRVNGVLLV